MKRVLRFVSLAGIGFLVITVMGCTNKENVAGKVIAEVQKDVPFTIIVPSYLPRGISIVPAGISGPTANEIHASVVMGITYGNSSQKFVSVTEENVNISWVPTHPYVTYNINGVEVMSQSVAIGSATKIISGLMYVWNRNGIHFEVDVYGYDQTQGNKVVESMIK
jgi:hypothetical protein